jgi:hypothetical protein
MNVIPASIPSDLRARKQWVIQRAKVPHTTMGYRASVINPDHLSTFEAAMAAAARPGFCDGIGFVFSEADPYCGLDLDNVWRSDADEGAPWAEGILRRFADTYAEGSSSDLGLKIWCRAKAPRCGRWPIGLGAVEIYDRARFFAVTGRSAGIVEITDHQADVQALIANLDGDRPRTQAQAIPNVIPRGQRHSTLVSLGGTMFRRGMPLEAIEAALLVTDRTHCDPPHGAQHVRKIVASMRGWTR